MLGWALLASAFLLLRRTQVGELVDKLNAVLPNEPGRSIVGRWAPQIAYGATHQVPADFPGGMLGFAFFGASVMEEETHGGDVDATAGAYQVADGDLWNGTGDRGRGNTPWQIDIGSHRAYLERDDRTPERDSAYAMGLLSSAWLRFSYLGQRAGLEATAAAYNAGVGGVQRVLQRGLRPDVATTPRNGRFVYASEIVDRWEQWTGSGEGVV